MLGLLTTIAQTNYYNAEPVAGGSSGAGILAGGILWIIYLAAIAILVVSMWKLFVKAGQPGWASIIPVYNTYIMIKMVNKPDWWIVLMFIPFVNFVLSIILGLELAKVFGKGTGFGLVLAFLPIIGYPMLAFDKSTQYMGGSPAASNAPMASPPAAPSTPAV